MILMFRALSLSIIAFWLVMTVLLVRSVYFPDGSAFAEVPAQKILKLFMDQGSALNTMHLYHGDKKIGHASLNAHRFDPKNDGLDYLFSASGSLDKGALPNVASDVSWRLDMRLDKEEQWRGLAGQIRLNAQSTVTDFKWERDQAFPTFTLKQKGVLIADDKTLSPMLLTLSGQNGLNLPDGSQASATNAAGLFKTRAREGIIILAGQKRKGYVLEFTVMDQYRAKAYFTEVGELALVELPDGYRMLEPVIYGLVPDNYDDDEQPKMKHD